MKFKIGIRKQVKRNLYKSVSKHFVFVEYARNFGGEL